MKIYSVTASILASAISASAQTYTPPNGSKYLVNVQVTRTDTGDEVHLKVTLSAPPVSESLPVCNQAFFYGWIATNKQRLTITQTKDEDSPYGFKAVRQTFSAGEKITLETDLPKAFVDAVGSHLHAGVGLVGGAYYPTQNLLVKK